MTHFQEAQPLPRGSLSIHLGDWRVGERRFLGLQESLDEGPGLEDFDWQRVLDTGGAGWSLGLLCRAALQQPEQPPLVLWVSEGLTSGLPTAVRTGVGSRSPLTGLYSEGQVGGELGANLGRVCQALSVSGPRRSDGAASEHVLLLEAAPGGALVELKQVPELAGCSGSDVQAQLEQRFGPLASLCTGSAGERGVALAGLWSSGDPAHFVGRGGLGARLGFMGLKAIAIRKPKLASSQQEHHAAKGLAQALTRSPRLRTRSASGTFELYAGRSDSEFSGTELGETFVAQSVGKHGCKGCPTPCGLVFEEQHGEQTQRRGARFSATRALGVELGLPQPAQALELLGLCDDLGLDAKEMGAVLGHADRCGMLAATENSSERLLVLRSAILETAQATGIGLELGGGVVGLAQTRGLSATFLCKGSPVLRRENPLELLAQCVSSRGAEFMRGFVFARATEVSEERRRSWLGPLLRDANGVTDSVGADAGAAHSAAGIGTWVWWYESLANFLDASGFCSFSGAGLLADGVVDWDQLAGWIAPHRLRAWPGFEEQPGATCIEAGQLLVLAQRRLNELYGVAPGSDLPDWLDRSLWPAWDQYRRLRGLGPNGALEPGLRGRVGLGIPINGVGVCAQKHLPDPRVRQGSGETSAAPGVCHWEARGPLGKRLGAPVGLKVALPAPFLAVLRELASQRPEAAEWLLDGAQPRVSGFREGQRLGAEQLVRTGDRIELLLAVNGGSGLSAFLDDLQTDFPTATASE